MRRIEPIVDEYEVHSLDCTCGVRTTATPPVGVPAPHAATKKALSALGVPADDPLRELASFFDGLRDAPPDHAGGPPGELS